LDIPTIHHDGGIVGCDERDACTVTDQAQLEIVDRIDFMYEDVHRVTDRFADRRPKALDS
jgi:hypothetical protein